MLLRDEESKTRYDEVVKSIVSKQVQEEKFREFISTIEKMEGICDSFDEEIWSGVVDYVTVYSKKRYSIYVQGWTRDIYIKAV